MTTALRFSHNHKNVAANEVTRSGPVSYKARNELEKNYLPAAVNAKTLISAEQYFRNGSDFFSLPAH